MALLRSAGTPVLLLLSSTRTFVRAILPIGVSNDTAALSALYSDTGGAAWTSKLNWMAGSPSSPCDWFGVSCGDGNVVVDLDLNSNSLVGSLSPQLGLLTGMRESFSVYSNRLTGALPSQLGLLTGMTSNFYLFSNSVTGTLPPQLGLLTGITRFSLRSNSLWRNTHESWDADQRDILLQPLLQRIEWVSPVGIGAIDWHG